MLTDNMVTKIVLISLNEDIQALKNTKQTAILDGIRYGIEAYDKKIEFLEGLKSIKTLEELFEALKSIGHPIAIDYICQISSLYNLVILYPDYFIEHFKRDYVIPIVYSAVLKGDLVLVKCLVDKLGLDVKNDGIYPEFSKAKRAKPLIQVASLSSSVDMMKYALSFYHLAELDLSAEKGLLQEVMLSALEMGSPEVAIYLLDLGVNPNAKFPKDHYTTKTMNCALRKAHFPLVAKLFEKGFVCIHTKLEDVFCTQNKDIIALFMAQGFIFGEMQDTPQSVLRAIIKRTSPEFVQYCIEKYGLTLSKDNADVKHVSYNQTNVLEKVLERGDLKMLCFLEHSLGFPVNQMIRQEIDKTECFHHMFGDFLCIDMVTSFAPDFIEEILVNRGLMPSNKQLHQLLAYAYDNGAGCAQFKKFITFCYINSLCHPDQRMRQIYQNQRNIVDYSQISSDDLFCLFADMTLHFPQKASGHQYGLYFRIHSEAVAQEIIRRDLSFEQLLHLVYPNNQLLTSSIQFFLTVYPTKYVTSDVIELFKNSAFDVNYNYESCSLLQFAIVYNRKEFIRELVRIGASADNKTDSGTTPLSMCPVNSDYFKLMLNASTSVVNTLNQEMTKVRSNKVSVLVEHLKGDLSCVVLKDFLLEHRANLSNLFAVLSKLDIPHFESAKDILSELNDGNICAVIQNAEEFRATGKKPVAMVEFDKPTYLPGFGGCCGFGQMNAVYREKLVDNKEEVDAINEIKEAVNQAFADPVSKVNPDSGTIVNTAAVTQVDALVEPADAPVVNPDDFPDEIEIGCRPS